MADVIKITTNKDYHINKMYLDGNFSPIGWSKDGYFAYAEYFEGKPGSCGKGARDEISAVYIMNTVTDEIIEKVTNKDISFEEFWQLEEYKITAMLKKHNIISLPNIELKNIELLEEIYGIRVYFTFNDPEDNYWSAYDSLIVEKNEKSKEIAELYTAWSVREIIGYYKNPFEDRIVIYVLQTSSEGPAEGLTFYYFFGCHLNIGFN
ncbi:hypothetical protein FACS1894172_14760 [Spirochaetia bacterium]|nr:hypothetical protein FACS1894164_16060 [Spirochaetia bacterium]GHU34460.1 hypothetical protein FACS1894172_14760 [Spirochaetia bacterium]